LCSCLLALALVPKRIPVPLALLLGLIGARLLASVFDWLIFGMLQWYFIFFALGVWLRRRRAPSTASAVRAAAIVGFPVLSVFALEWLPVAAPPLALGRNAVLYYAGRLVWALAGIAFAWGVTDLAIRRWSLRPARMLGVITIEIYTTHMLFLGVGIGAGWVRVVSAWACATLLGVAVSLLLDRFALTRAVLFGRWRSEDPFVGLRASLSGDSRSA